MKKFILKLTVATLLVAGAVGVVATPKAVDTAAEIKPLLDPGTGTRPPS
ncbi:hypothetical protein [Bacillus infantis]|nr:hypothetical protein [Bacillus infantis]